MFKPPAYTSLKLSIQFQISHVNVSYIVDYIPCAESQTHTHTHTHAERERERERERDAHVCTHTRGGELYKFNSKPIMIHSNPKAPSLN